MAEAELQWVKSSSSLGNNACLELAVDGAFILVRHSQRPDVTIRYSKAEMIAFFEGVHNNEFDDLTGR